MLNSKFIDILKSLTKEEIRLMRDFIHSPFHNSNKNVIRLYELIRKDSPKYNSASIEKEKLYQKLYPGKKYNDTVMRILLSDLLRCGEEFLVQLNSRRNPAGDELLLLTELKDRGLYSLYRSNYKNLAKRIEESQDSRTALFSKFEMEIINVDFHLRNDNQQMITGNVLSRAEYLLYFTLIELVRNMHDLIMNERTYNAKFELNTIYEFFGSFDFAGLLEKLKRHRPADYPLLNTYYRLLIALQNEADDVYYDEFKKSIEQYSEGQRDDELYHFLSYLESCCLNRMKYNPPKYEKELFNVYKIMLSTGNYSYGRKGEMPVQKFKNILIAAYNVGEIQWCKEFSEKYLEKVSEIYQSSMEAYCGTLISFWEKDFEKSLEQIGKVKYDYFTLKMDVKSWLLKIYYELAYFEPALSLIDSYKHFISKNSSVSDHFKERHMLFIRFVSEMIKLRAGKQKSDIEKLRFDYLSAANIVHKVWVNEKIKELEAGHMQ